MRFPLYTHSLGILVGVLGVWGIYTNILPQPVFAQMIQGDGTTPTTPVSCAASCTIDGGTQVGNNLLHSFSQFSIDPGQSVYFTDPGVVNILTRVTGISPSDIQGRLGVTGAANLFLINPNGVTFGPNASLDVPGSLVVTTANAIRLQNGDVFSANAADPLPSQVLNVNPSALLFNQIAAQSITNQAILQVPNDRSLVLVGGNLTLNGGQVKAPRGRVELASVAGATGSNPSEVGVLVNGNSISLSVPSTVPTGDISLTNGAGITVGSSDRAGSIQLVGRNITLANTSSVLAETVDQPGGDITIAATRLQLFDGSLVSTSNFGTGQGGNLVINASTSVETAGIFNPGLPGGFLVEVNGSGRGGNLTLNTPNLTVAGGASISTSVFSSGRGGELRVNARQIDIRGEDVVSGFESNLAARTFNSGNAGSLTIETDRLLVRDGGQVSVSTFRQGNGGTLTVNATQSVIASGDTGLNRSGLFARVNSNGTGRGGDLIINTPTLTIQAGAAVSSAVFGTGQGGNVTVNAGQSIQVVGAGPRFVSSLTAFADNTGNAGNVTLTTRQLQVQNGGEISTGTFSSAQGGRLTIQATDSVEVSGVSPDANQYPSTIFVDTSGTGNAGSLRLDTGRLSILNGGQVSAGTSGAGQGGSLVVNAQDIQISGSVPATPAAIGFNFYEVDGRLPSGLITSSRSTGTAGDMTIATSTLAVQNGGQIAASTTGAGPGGDVSINATTSVQLTGKGSNGSPSLLLVSSEGAGNAGDLTIVTPTLTIDGGAQASASTLGAGQGGKVTVTADEVTIVGMGQLQDILDRLFLGTITRTEEIGSGIFAASFGSGRAGDLNLTSRNLTLQNGAFVSTSPFKSGPGGNLTLTASDTIRLIGSQLIGESYGSGNAGIITIRTNQLIATEGGAIAASAFGQGQGGTVLVTANSIDFIGLTPNNRFKSGLFANAYSNATTRAGDLRIFTDRLTIKDGAGIGAATFGPAQGGQVEITALEFILIDGANLPSQEPSNISTQSGGPGNAGDLNIRTAQLTVQNGGSIVVKSSGTGRAGNLNVTATNLLLDNDGTLSAATTLGDGGNITLTAQDIRLRRSSPIIATAGSSGNGSNITINTRILIALENSDILANAQFGTGGNIRITAPIFLADIFALVGRNPGDLAQFRGNDRVEISASSEFGTSGVVAVPEFSFLQDSLNQLDIQLVDTSQIVAGSCIARRNAEQGSFTVTGTGGLPRTPYNPQIGSRYELTSVQPIAPSVAATSPLPSPASPAWKLGDPIQEAQGIIMTADRRILLAATQPSITEASRLVCDRD